jgi:hypothetical protein
MTDDWYSYGQIRFNKAQIIWVLSNLNELRFGIWPELHRESGYERDSGHENGQSKRISCEGRHVKACTIAAEIDIRLDMIPLPQRYWPQYKYTDGVPYKEIAKFEHVTEDEIRHEIGRTVRYLAGWKRPLVDYETWKRERRKYKITVSV